MTDSNSELDFTGEYFVPGKSGERIEADHLERYRFACKFAKGKLILDIACGVGYAGPMLMQAGAIRYYGVDINERLINYAKNNYASELINYSVGDICTFNNEKFFDLITCYETIEHIRNYETAIQNLYKLLKPGGNLLISSPNRVVTSPTCKSLSGKPSNEFHTQEFIPEELISHLNRNGFTTDKANLFGQRQRKKVYRNRYFRKIIYTLAGNPDIKTSPEVIPVVDRLPRYFVVVAERK